MDTSFYAYVITILAFALVVALGYISALIKELSATKANIEKLHREKCGLRNTLSTRLERIYQAKNQITAMETEIAKLTEDLRVAKEELKYVYETVSDQEELIKQKDEELAYNEQYMEGQNRVNQLSQKEIDDLHKKLSEVECPEHVKSCLLEKINECSNLRHLNELLEQANASYAKDLARIKSEFQEMMQRVSATEFAQIRTGEIDPDAELKQNEYRPDLGPENCTSQEPQIPADSIDANQVSACI